MGYTDNNNQPSLVNKSYALRQVLDPSLEKWRRRQVTPSTLEAYLSQKLPSAIIISKSARRK